MPEPRRAILMLIPELGYGGAERVLMDLARALAAHHRVEIATFAEPAAGAAARIPGHPEAVHALDAAEGGAPQPGKIARWRRRRARLGALKRRLGIDATISFLSGANLLNAHCRAGDAVILTHHGSRRDLTTQSRLSRDFWWWFGDPLMVRGADVAVAVSKGLRSELAASAWAGGRDRVIAIPNAFDAEALVAAAGAPVEPELAVLAGEPVLMGIGRLHVQKAFHTLIPVLARIRAGGLPARLVLIGDGPEEGPLVAAARRAGFSAGRWEGRGPAPEVLLLGYRPTPHRYLRLARAFTLASPIEGFPLILCEALAAAAPVFASDCPWGPREILSRDHPETWRPFAAAAPETVAHGVLMPNPARPGADLIWADRLAAHLADPAALAPVAARGPERVRDFDRGRILPLWLDLIERAIREARRD